MKNYIFLHPLSEKAEATAVQRLARGPANVLQYSFTNDEIVDQLISHPLSMVITDAKCDPEGVQNPACFGNFPKFLQRAREQKTNSLEQIVYKMTGAPAERFGLENRGLVKNGYQADITVFDWENVRDNTTRENTTASPDGILYVLINGEIAVDHGEYTNRLDIGQTIRSKNR